MLYKPSTPKLISGSRRTGITGETKVPGAPHEPAKSCSPTPSTRPHDPDRNYKPSSHQQKRTEESFLQVSSAPISSKNSTDATTSTNAAVSAAPQAKQTTTFGINTVPRLPPYALPEQCGGRSAEGLGCFASHLTHVTTAKTTFTNAAVTAAASQMAGQPKLATSLHATRTDESIKRSTAPPTIITDSARSSAFWAKNTIAKTHAAATAAPQAAEPPGTATSRAVRTMEMSQRSTTPPTTVIINGDMDLFTGKPERVDKDGDCLFSSLAIIVQSDKKQVREKTSAWLKAHPNTQLQSCTLSEHVMYETGEVWSAYCARPFRDAQGPRRAQEAQVPAREP